ncbi:hypothetical protein GCM10026988_04040 [Vibrio panuliri]
MCAREAKPRKIRLSTLTTFYTNWSAKDDDWKDLLKDALVAYLITKANETEHQKRDQCHIVQPIL